PSCFLFLVILLTFSVLCLVFLRWSAPPSMFASFPTRRSSDLAAAEAGLAADDEIETVGGRPIETWEEATLAILDELLGDGLIDIDRKSTRLNSSHVKISYAVFCLKKKKKAQST